eukprot:TRINITY_DN16983_c0_g1_i1.p1 TRINITY_DN16983_c0_g1~~TRINITY_DN16983_c0_g1_i1.p1  ORF type:complete len:344 (+),score=92.28 TRINITY_DN16983_c0_g1_i1:121-1152(+)
MPRFYMDELGVEVSSFVWRSLRPRRKGAGFLYSDVLEVLTTASLLAGAEAPSDQRRADEILTVADIVSEVRSTQLLAEIDRRMQTLTANVFENPLVQMGRGVVEQALADGPLLCRCERLVSVYAEVAAVTAGISGLSWSWDDLKHLARLRTTGPDRRPMGEDAVWKAWIGGPVASLGLPRGWWRCEGMCGGVRVQKSAVLASHQGLAVHYLRGAGQRSFVRRVLVDRQAVDEHECASAMKKHLGHLLHSHRIELLCQWLYTADAESEDEVDIKVPSLQAAFKYGAAALKDVDLQTCSEAVLEEYKELMDKDFKPTKPGDPGYEYRKSERVQPTSKSGWDDDSD